MSGLLCLSRSRASSSCGGSGRGSGSGGAVARATVGHGRASESSTGQHGTSSPAKSSTSQTCDVLGLPVTTHRPRMFHSAAARVVTRRALPAAASTPARAQDLPPAAPPPVPGDRDHLRRPSCRQAGQARLNSAHSPAALAGAYPQSYVRMDRCHLYGSRNRTRCDLGGIKRDLPTVSSRSLRRTRREMGLFAAASTPRRRAAPRRSLRRGCRAGVAASAVAAFPPPLAPGRQPCLSRRLLVSWAQLRDHRPSGRQLGAR